MKNIFNIIIIAANMSCLITRLACLIYSMIDNNSIVRRYYLSHYVFYQVTFDLINITLMAHCFQWIEALIALKSQLSTIYTEKIDESTTIKR